MKLRVMRPDGGMDPPRDGEAGEVIVCGPGGEPMWATLVKTKPEPTDEEAAEFPEGFTS